MADTNITDTNIIKYEFEDQLKIEGVNCKGFGILPKYVMLDPDLSLEAKTIYAYFCSFAGNGNTAFPSWQTIVFHLQLNKDTYYKHLKQLTEQGYLTITQERAERSIFAHNIYTLVSNPKKFEEKPDDGKKALAYSKIRFSGIKAAGYGMIPKAIMIDERLKSKSKGIYAYFCSFTGSGNNAFPKLEKILFHLHIGRQAYYKHYNELVTLNYITVVQRHIDGRLSVNDYFLNDTPDTANAAKKAVLAVSTQGDDFSETVQHNSTIQSDDFSEAEKQEAAIQGDEKQEAGKSERNINKGNKNKFIKNSLYKNHSLNQQPAQPEQIEGMSDDEIYYEVMDELTDGKELPFQYKTDYRRMTAAIHIMTEWHTFFPDGYKDELRQNVYNLFNEALIEMCCAEGTMKLKGSLVTYAKVIERINRLAKFEATYVDISAFSETAMNNFTNAAVDTEIKNPLQYMKSCIWDALLTGQVSMFADLRRMGY